MNYFTSVTLKQLFMVIIALLIPTFIAMVIIDQELKVASAPFGIISLELCGYNYSLCETILKDWGEQGKAMAMLSLGLDYLFMVLYPIAICFGMLLTLPNLSVKIRRLTLLLAWISLLSIPLDAVENIVLIQVVLGQSSPVYSLLGSYFATAKLLINGFTIAWLMVVAVIPLLGLAFRKVSRIVHE